MGSEAKGERWHDAVPGMPWPERIVLSLARTIQQQQAPSEVAYARAHDPSCRWCPRPRRGQCLRACAGHTLSTGGSAHGCPLPALAHGTRT